MSYMKELTELCGRLGCRITPECPLSGYDTFKIGGPCRALVSINSTEAASALIRFLRSGGIKYGIIGRGSNILVPDEGFDGIVLLFGGDFADISVDGNRIICQSGALLASACVHAQQNSLTGMENLFGIPGTVGGALYMNAGAYDSEMADIVVEEKVPVVTTGAGNPGIYIKKWKEAGIIVMPVVPSVSLARRMEKAGVDAVIAEGTESGGHVGELTTMALVPQVKAAVNIPVIVAGGIASGKQLLAALALGADGVQVGTILLASTECPIHQNYKNAIIKAKDTDTTVTGRIAGTPVRILKNKMARTYIKKEKEGAEMMELEKYTLGSLKRAVFEGDVETGSLMSGQVAGMVHEERSLKEIIEGLFKEYEEEKKRVMEVHL